MRGLVVWPCNTKNVLTLSAINYFDKVCNLTKTNVDAAAVTKLQRQSVIASVIDKCMNKLKPYNFRVPS